MRIKTASLTPDAKSIICDKKTEAPFFADENPDQKPGTYLCRQCGLGLFHSQDGFHSGCGWPSFDASIKGAILYQKDADGIREEILCHRCHAHLGHVFYHEGFTEKNTRFCVNSLSLDFVEGRAIEDSEEGIFAGGCFWGIEYYFKHLNGVMKTEVGYTGGSFEHPRYEDVCMHKTGHYEAIRVVYDPKVINYESIAKYFFEIHDPTQKDGQGPDLGQQYQSVAFYYDEEQKQILERLIQDLKNSSYDVATHLLPVSPFWPAEAYHQDYYTKTKHSPYCHHYEKRFK